MTEHQTSRTLVKSAPELWAECSEAASLARHLGAFGEIRITRLEPETTVAWEGAAASGTVRLEPSGWGTRVTLTLVRETDAAPGSAGAPETDGAAGPDGATAPELTEPAEPTEPTEPTEPAEPTERAEEPAEPAEEPAERAEGPAAPLSPRPGIFARLTRMLRRRPASDGQLDEANSQAEGEISPQAHDPGPAAEAGEAAEAQGVAVTEPETEGVAAAAPEAEVVAAAEPEAEGVAAAEPEAEGELVLAAALDSLGRAHHRPYSRA